MKTIIEMRQAIDNEPARGAWSKAVKEYAHELLENIADSISSNCSLEAELPEYDELEEAMLNGAKDWNQYSWGGCSLIYNGDIAARVCSPSEFKKSKEGEYRPNRNEEWLDVQARALTQAERMIKRLAR